MTSSSTSPSLSILHGPVCPALLRHESLADLFAATVRRCPENTALIFGAVVLSYAELDARAERVAARLVAAGVKPGDIVGLWLARGIELLVMQLGIAKSGAAWLPFDAETPLDRVRVCLEDAAAVGLLTDTSHASHALHTSLPCPYWDAEALLTPHTAPLRQRAPMRPDHPAYVIYTSGSTGKPKGIRIDQGAICHFLRSENSILQIQPHDRVYQGFSVAFDMSFEEIWISYLVGASLWIAPRELTGDPDALPQALIDQRITVLHAVPTLLALFERDIPDLRLINLGGEACPESLVSRWARPGRQVFNTYGPSEATVSASLAELHAGAPVTIGQPLPNYSLLVIDSDVSQGLRLLPRDTTGELCIVGPGVSAGYPGRAELTAEKFLPNPWATGVQDDRLYRTGDLARIDSEGQIHCLGRVDDQVKIRGYRVELGEIEAVLCQQPGIGTAAVLLRQDDGLERLVAYLVAEGSVPVPAETALRHALSTRLPPYMVPGHFEVLEAMPRLTSGKIDRKALRARPLQPASCATHATHTATDHANDPPASPEEALLMSELSRFFPGAPLHREADFFADLGGHSLLAARLASALRAHPRYARFTVRDIYQHRTIQQIATALARHPDPTENTAADPATRSTPTMDWPTPSPFRRGLCALAQLAIIPCLVVLNMAQWLSPFFTYHYFTGDPGDSIPRAIALSIGMFLLAVLSRFLLAIAGKWLILGRLQAGRYPLWGLTYFRWWLSDRLIESTPTYLLNGSPLYIGWLRALGARIGHDVLIGSLTLRAHDLLDIGNGVSIGNAVNLENVRVERGELHVGPITLNDEACIGSYAVLEGDTGVGIHGHLDGQSALGSGMRVPAGRCWRGSPAHDTGAVDTEALPPRPTVSRGRRHAEMLLFMAGVMITSVIFFIPVFPSFILVDWLDVWLPWQAGGDIPMQLIRYFLISFPGTAVLIVCTALLSAAMRWSFLPRLHEGRWPVHGSVYYSRWLVNQIQEASLNVLHGVYATVYAPYWYRLLGARVGRDAEISTAQGLIPDLLTLGDETFIADAVMLGDEEIEGGWITLRPTLISRRSFVGNGAYVPDGTILPENVLIGVHSRAPQNHQMQPGETWLGSPPLLLPAREETQGFPAELTFHPTPLRRLLRALIEAFRIITPHAFVIAAGYTVVLNLMPLAGAGRWGSVLGYLVIAGLLYGLMTFLFVALLKWL
ncbi:MAG: amino acid adenylation domain-containing protein, partial [Sterolibacterium sp.]|nr:amino acid adenylation domain-containing protein [Sterolibacterium sp.]